MKICLISPPKLKYFPGESTIPPIGLAYLAGILEKNNIEVSIIDAAAERLSPEGVVKKLLDIKPNIIGITSSTPAYPAALKIIKLSKKLIPEAKVILGGSHGTFMPEDALKDGFDTVIRGEGELTLLELCKKGFSKLKEIKGLSFAAGNKIFHNENREFIKNLDELPFPSYHLLPFDLYQKMTPPSNVMKSPWMSYYSSRGCPFGCIFCSVTTFWGRIWRGHSAERMINDMERLIKTYKLRTIFFVDDNFTFNRKRIIDFCDKVKERKLKFEWSCSCRVDQVDEELLKKMKEAGCWRIGFGVEAGNQKVIDWYGKKITVEKAKNAIRMCKKVGLSTSCFFIMGAPFESEEMINDTIKAMKEIDPDLMGLGFLTPFPGSKLYDYSLENNLILTNNWEKFDELLPMMKSSVSEKRLLELSRKAYREFYFRPSYILRQIKEAVRNPRLTVRALKTIFQRVTLKK